MDGECVFCKIAKGEIPSKRIYEDDTVLAFYDAAPQAPVHFLVIPKVHIKSMDEINGQNSEIVARVYEAIAKIARELDLTNGYRVVCNCKDDGGQTVEHLHFHVLAKRKLTWPPG